MSKLRRNYFPDEITGSATYTKEEWWKLWKFTEQTLTANDIKLEGNVIIYGTKGIS